MIFVNQIVAAALIAGVGIFLLVALFITDQPMACAGRSPLEIVCVVLLVSALLTGPLLAKIVTSQSLSARGDEGVAAADPVDTGRRLLAVYQTQMLATLATLEGAALFGAIVFLLQRSPVGLGVAVAGMGLMALRFPTRRRVEAWLAAHVVECGGSPPLCLERGLPRVSRSSSRPFPTAAASRRSPRRADHSPSSAAIWSYLNE